MKKKRLVIFLVVIIIAIVGVVIYKKVAGNNIERKTYDYLIDEGYDKSDIDNIEIKHSFINKILGYNEWRIFVQFEVEEDIVFAFTYRNNEILIQGVKSDKQMLTKEEIELYETKFESVDLKNENKQMTLN